MQRPERALYGLRVYLCIVIAAMVSHSLVGSIAAGAVHPSGETATTPMPDDPAVWVHPTDPARSMVIGTNKASGQGGLYAWSLQGGSAIWSSISADTAITNNVDVRYHFQAGSDTWDLLAATNRTHRTIDFYRVRTDAAGDFDSLSLAGRVDIGAGFASSTNAPYGCALMQYGESHSVFISDKTGHVAQYTIGYDSGTQAVTASRVAFWQANSDGGEVEGLVADDQRGVVYVASENVGIERYTLDAAGVVQTASPTVVATVGQDGLVADIEGLSLYYSSEDRQGYLLASSQGNSQFAIFDRAFQPDHANPHLFNFQITADPNDPSLDAATATDGIDVMNLDLGGNYTGGLFLAHDDNGGSNESYKLVAWEDIATLPADPADHLRYIGDGAERGWDPRTRTAAPEPATALLVGTTLLLIRRRRSPANSRFC
jgi:3-phytase